MDYFIGEIRAFPYGIVPNGWHVCDGSLLQIQQSTALFSLLGTAYGGDGTKTFGLPDLRGRAMLSSGIYRDSGQIQYQNGQKGGNETVAITATQMPLHIHTMSANSTPGTVTTAAGNFPATIATPNLYASTATAQSTMAADAVASNAGDQPHNNMQPSLTLNYCISTVGIYPPRT